MKKKVPPRQTPSRDDYYMGLSFFIASKAKDPNTQVGSVIVSSTNVPLGVGYNGPPRGIDDNLIDWDRPEKYDWVIHAESNAIKHSPHGYLQGSNIYITAPPCKKCMLEIIAVGIKRIVYFTPKKIDEKSSLSDKSTWDKTVEIAELGNVSLESYKGSLNWMRDRMNYMESTGVFDE